MTSALLALALAPGLRQEPIPDRPVTFSCPPTRLENLLPALSQKAGVRLVAATKTRDDVVVMSVREAKPAEIMKRLADTVGAQWETAEGGYRLVRTTAFERQEEQEEARANAARLRPALAKLAAEVPPALDAEGAKSLAKRRLALSIEAADPSRDGGWTPERHRAFSERHVSIQQDMPETRLLLRLLSEASPDLFAGVPRGNSVVFSTSPTRMQRRLPPSATSAFESYRADQGALVQAFGAMAGSSDTLSEQLGIPFPSPLGSRAKFLLHVGQFESGQWHFEGWVVNSEGKIAAHHWRQLLARELPPSPSPFTSREKKVSVELSSLAEAGLKGTFLAWNGRPIPSALRGSVMPALLDPSRTDPLGLTPAQGFQSLGEVLKENVIALVPDTVFGQSIVPARWLFGEAEARTLTVEKFDDHLRENQMRITREGGWLLARPEERSRARRQRIHRGLLKTFFGILSEGRLPWFDEWLVLAASPSGEFLPELGPSLPGIAAPGLGLSFNDDANNLKRLALFAILSPVQRQAALSEAGLSTSTFTPEQRRRYERWIFAGGPSGALLTPTTGEHFAVWRSSVRVLPSESLPNGLPNDGVLKFILEQLPLCARQAEDGRWTTWLARTLGEAVYRREVAGKPPYGTSEYAYGQSTAMQGTLRAGGVSAEVGRVILPSFDPRQKSKLQDAPAWVLDGVRQGYELAKKQAGGS